MGKCSTGWAKCHFPQCVSLIMQIGIWATEKIGDHVIGQVREKK